MKIDAWGFPILDWSLAPKEKRRQLNAFKPGDCVDLSYLGLPNLLAYGNTVDGDKFLVGPNGTLYTFEDFEHAAKMTFGAYMRSCAASVVEGMGRVQAMADRELRDFTITFTDKKDEFDFKVRIITAVDLSSAMQYADAHLPPQGKTVINVAETN